MVIKWSYRCFFFPVCKKIKETRDLIRRIIDYLYFFVIQMHKIILMIPQENNKKRTCLQISAFLMSSKKEL
jgi:hypothetical protein